MKDQQLSHLVVHIAPSFIASMVSVPLLSVTSHLHNGYCFHPQSSHSFLTSLHACTLTALDETVMIIIRESPGLILYRTFMHGKACA